jgi:hypothetical protein
MPYLDAGDLASATANARKNVSALLPLVEQGAPVVVPQPTCSYVLKKEPRRVALGDNVTVLFENRETVLFQIQEMVRTERIVDAANIQDEIDAYDILIPRPAELSATLFIEIPDIARMTTAQMRQAVNRFQRLDRDSVWLHVGRTKVPARFESGNTQEEKMAAVHYLRFAVPPEGRAALADATQSVQMTVEHPLYQAEAAISPALRAEMAKDVAAT